MTNGDTGEPHALESLPPELLTLVAEDLDARCLAKFAATSTMCLAAAHDELGVALRTAVHRCLQPGSGPVSDDLVRCPYFRLPDNVVAIPAGAFRGSALTKLTLPAALTTIGDRALEGTSLTELALPTTVTTIGICACRNCFCLAKLTLPDTVATIGLGAFGGCICIAELVLPAGLTIISNRAFRGMRALTKLTLPVALTTIGSYAFEGCSSLVDVSTLPATLTAIGDFAFRGCISLSELTLPASGTLTPFVGRDAFGGCTSMTSVYPWLQLPQ